jgi:hypothetical protein
MKPFQSLATALCLCLVPVASVAQTVSPAKGQDSAQQSRDISECSAQATQQTGFNPAAPPPPQASASPQVAGSGSRARGAAAGAMIGGATGNDAGAGAAAGAVAGGVSQRSKSRGTARQQNEATAQQQQTGQAAYTQAKNACLTSRGYTVK